MRNRLLPLFLVASAASVANAATITFQTTSQTITLGANTTVTVSVAGLSTSQVLGAFDLVALNNSSILQPVSVLFLSDLGNPTAELTGSSFTPGSAEAAETSFASTAALLSLQSGMPFSLFQLTYTAVGVGVSSLTLGIDPETLADGTGALFSAPTSNAGSIAVVAGAVSPVPEPSTFTLLGSGASLLVLSLKRMSRRGLSYFALTLPT